MNRWGRITLAVGSPALLWAMWLGGPVGEWLFVVTCMLFPVALLALGAPRPRRRAVSAALGVLGAVLQLGGLGMLAVGGETWGRWLGLPAGALIMLGGLGVLPLMLVTAGYATLFDEASDRSRTEGDEP